MAWRHDREPDFGAESRAHCEGGKQSLGGFVRSLLSGIPWSESAQSEETVQWDAPSKRALRLMNGNGRTRVIGEDRDNIEMRVLKKARAESVEAADELLEHIQIASALVAGELELEVEVPRKWNRHGNASIELHVPRGMRIAISTANGKICAKGLRGHLRARSDNGAVHIEDVVGDIQVETANAKVCCNATSGRLQARSSNGKIEVDEHRGSIDATTSNGLIYCALEELGESGVRLATSNGRIVVELPDEVDAEVDVRVDNGIIRNARELVAKGKSESAGRLRGRLGRGGAPIRLRTSNGTVSLR